ncbi:MAG: carboxymuconolactone decarboxylase family protein [Candidatus Coatesbacteria bacterium]|nr:MAG: carboxymuconolactone decarboxylase family protein [Candidatus Coatesbacteria bacterium]
MTSLDEFKRRRDYANELILSTGDKVLNRFFNLDQNTYRPGALDAKTKELLGLVASLVLRCDDCVTYHTDRLMEEGVTMAELIEAVGVGLVVGGSITIPHIRRLFERLEEYEKAGKFDMTVEGD